MADSLPHREDGHSESFTREGEAEVAAIYVT